MRVRILSLFVSSLVTISAFAHEANQPPHQLFAEGDFKLESGETIKDFSISYVTHGTLNADKSNAILMVPSIGGNHHRIDYLIGAGKALEPAKYFIICTDSIGNGLTTSPSNSKAQPRMQFPKFNIRDMVNSQQRLVAEKFGIKKLVTVIGASMGGMQALQWAVSYPDMMTSIVPIIPLARTPAWTTGVLEMLRQSIMTDARWKDGTYAADAPPEQGMRLWAGWLSGVIVRTPGLQEKLYPNAQDEIAYLKGVQDGGWKRMDATDWIYQSWAYDMHNVGTTKGFNGDTAKALQSIKAKTLILAGSGDLLNPEYEATEAAKHIAGARYVPINDKLPMGHYSGAGSTAPENEVQNREVAAFLGTLAKN
ncbi:alpha/beta fold hydrolase [Roseiterribacter gracilis]|uniref:Homoserine O-acetyltransferase n=1 Tax=Roseiterribacter gracilis TaxID=2812848 RepID=A0A8S8X7Z7_9PROT|nr:homoserine O-acetyltransferase [Rhodospirillales bacterium TMPK1]